MISLKCTCAFSHMALSRTLIKVTAAAYVWRSYGVTSWLFSSACFGFTMKTEHHLIWLLQHLAGMQSNATSSILREMYRMCFPLCSVSYQLWDAFYEPHLCEMCGCLSYINLVTEPFPSLCLSIWHELVYIMVSESQRKLCSLAALV